MKKKTRTDRVNPGPRKVYKFTEDGLLVKIYNSMREASIAENIPQTSLKVLYIDKIRDGFIYKYTNE